MTWKSRPSACGPCVRVAVCDPPMWAMENVLTIVYEIILSYYVDKINPLLFATERAKEQSTSLQSLPPLRSY